MLIKEFFSSVNNQEELENDLKTEVPEEYTPPNNVVFSQVKWERVIINNDTPNGNITESKLNLNSERKIFFSFELRDYDENEKYHIDNFLKTLKSDKKLAKVLENDPSTIFDMFRFLVQSNFDYSIAKDNIINYLSFFQEGFPTNKNYLKLIKYGYIYIQGRDKFYRPNIVIDINRIIEYCDKIEISDFVRSVIFVLEFVIRFKFIRGKVENWNIIINLDVQSKFNNMSLKLKGFYSEIVTRIINFYPFRTNKIFIFLRTEQFYLRKESNTIDIEVYEFFKNYITDVIDCGIIIINHELSNLYLSILKQFSIKNITLLDFFNDYISKDEVEERYFGSLNNIKSFFEFVNSNFLN